MTMTMTAQRIGLLLALLTAVKSREHKIALYADEEFKGASVEVTLHNPTAVSYCDTVGEDWRKRVSSVHTRENCYELYDQVGCKGNILYLFPGSPSHNKFTDLGWNDRMQSFRICDLDEEKYEDACSSGSLCRRSMDPRRPEKGFWDYFFENYITNYWQAYQNRIASGARFITWDFLPGVTGSKGQQYQRAIEWIMDLADADRLTREIMEGMRTRANQVLNDRDERNRQYGTNTASGAIHLSVANLWRTLIRVLSDSINRAIQREEDDYDEHNL